MALGDKHPLMAYQTTHYDVERSLMKTLRTAGISRAEQA